MRCLLSEPSVWLFVTQPSLTHAVKSAEQEGRGQRVFPLPGRIAPEFGVVAPPPEGAASSLQLESKFRFQSLGALG